MRIHFDTPHIPPIAEPSPGALRWAQVFSLMASLLAAGVGTSQPGSWPAGLAIAGLVVAVAIEFAIPPMRKSVDRR
ncbi:MAG TPA: hypothetical protein VGM74_02140 [Burkholderiaceae bacterium]|jgi:hypothetical protein